MVQREKEHQNFIEYESGEKAANIGLGVQYLRADIYRWKSKYGGNDRMVIKICGTASLILSRLAVQQTYKCRIDKIDLRRHRNLRSIAPVKYHKVVRVFSLHFTFTSSLLGTTVYTYTNQCLDKIYDAFSILFCFLQKFYRYLPVPLDI